MCSSDLLHPPSVITVQVGPTYCTGHCHAGVVALRGSRGRRTANSGCLSEVGGAQGLCPQLLVRRAMSTTDSGSGCRESGVRCRSGEVERVGTSRNQARHAAKRLLMVGLAVLAAGLTVPAPAHASSDGTITVCMRQTSKYTRITRIIDVPGLPAGLTGLTCKTDRKSTRLNSSH